MQQYRVEFFKNAINEQNNHYLAYAHHDFMDTFVIDDDYLAIQSTVFEIQPTTKVDTGNFVRILRDDKTYFIGIVSNVAPAEYTTSVTVQPFVSIFDSQMLFDSAVQNQKTLAYSLENILKFYIEANYVNNSDNLQNLPLSVVVPEDEADHTINWDLNIGVDFLREDGEGAQKVVLNFYNTVIVNALKYYSVSIVPSVDFSTGLITLTIGKVSGKRVIDANLDNATITTLKVNDRPKGTNKLIVYDSDTYSKSAIFYVHPDRTWGPVDENRILPVSVEITTASPDPNAEDQDAAFALAAIEAAYQSLSGLEWDDLIELECAPNDVLIEPMTIKIGQLVTIYYKEGKYSSILTGRTLASDYVKLIFGSERIQFTKLRASNRKRR